MSVILYLNEVAGMGVGMWRNGEILRRFAPQDDKLLTQISPRHPERGKGSLQDDNLTLPMFRLVILSVAKDLVTVC